MSFQSVVLTDKGRDLQAKAQAGAQLTFTRIGLGDGELGSTPIAGLNVLIHEVKSLPLNKHKTLPLGKAVIGGILSNQSIVTGFYWREMGLFAQDPDLGEILYTYGNAGALAEYIPAGGGAEVLERQVDILSIVGNAANVSATIEQSLIYVTQDDLDILETEIQNQITPVIADSVLISSITPQTVLTFTPTTGGYFKAHAYFWLTAGMANVRIKINYTGPTGARSVTVLNTQNCPPGEYSIMPVPIYSIAGQPVSIEVTCNVSNRVSVSAKITGV